MTYIFKCQCGREIEAHMTMEDRQNLIMPTCSKCLIPMQQKITGGSKPFMRSPFPRGWSEHIAPDPVYVRDKVEAREIAAEHDLTSVLAENWDR